MAKYVVKCVDDPAGELYCAKKGHNWTNDPKKAKTWPRSRSANEYKAGIEKAFPGSVLEVALL